MSTDRHSSERDLTARQRPAGPGCAPMFLCGCCGRSKATTGRRRLKVRGLIDWVCAKCAEGKA